MSVTSGTTFRGVEFLHFHPLSLFVTCHHHLGHTLAILYHKVLVGEVYLEHHHLATVVGVDGTGGVEHGDAMFQSQSAAGTHLRFVSCGQRDE